MFRLVQNLREPNHQLAESTGTPTVARLTNKFNLELVISDDGSLVHDFWLVLTLG